MQRLTALLLILLSSVARPEPAVPFATRNQNPLVLIYGLPAPGAARPAAAGQWHTAWTLDAANMINIETGADEQLLIDGEVTRLTVTAERGLNAAWSAAVQVPFIRHSGGSLDRPIEEYHDLLGLRQGYRPDNPRDRLLYQYRRNGEERLGVTDTRSGPGDIRLTAARRSGESAAADYSVHVELKLPTGEADKLTGSGAADLSVWGAARRAFDNRWQVYGTAGITAVGEGDLLGDMQEEAVVFGSAGAQWQMYPGVAVKTQLEWHSAFYKDTDLRFLSDVVQLAFGGTWRTGDNTFLDIAIVEDIKEDASPDVNFHLSLRIEH